MTSAPVARTVRRTGIRLLHSLLLLALLSQPLAAMLTTPAQAATGPSWALPAAQEEPGGTIPPLDPDEEAAPPPGGIPEEDDITASGSFTPSLPVTLDASLDRPLLLVGESATLTATLYAEAAIPAEQGLVLRMDLPAGLATASGAQGTLEMAVPALAAGEAFVHAVDLVITTPAETLQPGMVELVWVLAAPGRHQAQASAWLGIAPEKPANEAVLGDSGAIVQNDAGDITLLVPAGAAATGVLLRYSELYNWAATPAAPVGEPGQPLTTTGTLTATNAAPEATAAVYLPLVEQAVGAPSIQTAQALTTTAPLTLPQTITSANVQAYGVWQLDATLMGEEVAHFATGVLLVVSASDLAAAGVDSDRLDLWTREADGERWTPLDARYDAAQQTFRAWLPHFSQFTLGEGLSAGGVSLPSMRAFSAERFSGAATVNIPIETPAGLGGLNPNLSLRYASTGMEELARKHGVNAFKVQTSGAGLGWRVDGLSYIARAGGSLDNDTPYWERHYVLVLNGQFARIQYEDGAWRSDPNLFARIDHASPGSRDYTQWVVTTADGVRYTFGEPNFNGVFTGVNATATHVHQQDGGAYDRLADAWHLVQVQDTLGNRIEYSYLSEQGVDACHVGSTSPLRFYTRAIYPSEIRWSQHSSGLGPHLRVQFEHYTLLPPDSYAAESYNRIDYRIEDWGGNDCGRPQFALRDRLTALRVQAWSGGAWQTLRSYTLTTQHMPPLSGVSGCDATNHYCRRLRLDSVDVRGKNNGVLQRYTFTYENSSPNNIRLKTASNGLGGKITYHYTPHKPFCRNDICSNGSSANWRQPVTKSEVEDGLGNKTTVTYFYGPPNSLGNEWGRVGDSGEFFGFIASEATYFSVNSTSNIMKWDRHETWQGPTDDPDPRRGRTQKVVVSSTVNGTPLAETVHHWQAYRRNYFDSGSCGGAVVGWCANPTTSNTHNNKQDLHTLWVRLDATAA